MSFKHGPFALAILLCLFAACTASPERTAGRARLEAAADARPQDGFAAPATKLLPEVSVGGWDDDATRSERGPMPNPERPDPMLVYRGQVRVEVAKADDVSAAFVARVAAWGGHLQRQVDRTFVVRVPASRFEEAFTWVRESGRVLSESRQTDDVTDEFVDLGIRLDNARKARDRLLEVLKQAEKIEDILKVEAELRRLTEEIERMEGRRKLLADQVAMSTLEATFQPLTEAPAARRVRPSRFQWINRIGPDRVMEEF